MTIKSNIINFTITHPRLNRAVDSFGKLAHSTTFGKYTPGLTRESFRLYNKTSPEAIVKIGKDGFYLNEEKIAGNKYISERIMKNGSPCEFRITKDHTPKVLADYCRGQKTGFPVHAFLFGSIIGLDQISKLVAPYIYKFHHSIDLGALKISPVFHFIRETNNEGTMMGKLSSYYNHFGIQVLTDFNHRPFFFDPLLLITVASGLYVLKSLDSFIANASFDHTVSQKWINLIKETVRLVKYTGYSSLAGIASNSLSSMFLGGAFDFLDFGNAHIYNFADFGLHIGLTAYAINIFYRTAKSLKSRSLT